jgi:hypothetical protein
MTRRLCWWALALYPNAWRARYEAELQALLEVRELTLRTLVDLLRAAFDAHLRPGRLVASPRQRMRGTIAAALSCWLAVVLLGASFAKATEDKPFRGSVPLHPAVADARLAIVILGVAAGLVVALAGAPLAYGVLRQARRERTPALVRAVCAAVAAVVGVAVATGLVALLARHSSSGWALGPIVLVFYGAVGMVAAIACALAARAGLMTARFSGAPLVLGVAGAWLLSRLLIALTLALAVYTVLLAIDSPSAAALPNGPLNINTTIMLASQAAGVALASWIATISAGRGMRALRGA